MTTSALVQIAAWSAYLSAAATIITFVMGILFFTKGEPFGTVNDAASVLQMLFMLPLAWVLHILLGRDSPALSLAATLIGSAGMLTAAVLQALLVIGRVQFGQTFSAVLAAGALTGVWLLVVGYLTLAGGALPGALAWLGIVAGSAYVLSAVAYFVSRRQGPVFFLGAAVGLIAYSVWAVWLGCVMW